MDYITYLIKANKALLNKVKQLQSEIKINKESEVDENTYYVKYNKVNAENLFLKEKIAKLELEVASTNHELEKRNKTIQSLNASNLKGMTL